MTCHDVRQSYAAMLAGGLALTEWALIEAHGLQCDECRQMLDQVFRTTSPEVAGRRAQHGKIFWNAYVLATGVAIAMLLLGVGGYAYRAMHHTRHATGPREAPAAHSSAAPSPPPVLAEGRSDAVVPLAPPVQADRGGAPATSGRAAPPRSADRAVAKPALPAGMDVVVQLAPQNRKGAERDLSSLVARVGGAKVARGRDATLRVTVPRSRYREFTRGLGRIGAWEVERRNVTLPDPVRVAVRLADT